MTQKLLHRFYNRDTALVARALLGQILVHVVDGKRLAGRIVETEAYIGDSDPACHSFGHRKSKRTQSMYRSGGHSYVYFIYGMHCCFNVVTRDETRPEAVLLRALEPLEGLETMRRLRHSPASDTLLTNGPGKLCEALKISREQDQIDLTSRQLYIKRGQKIRDSDVEATSRIGIDYAGEAANWPLRFYVKSSAFVSKR
jgi:DNA-3-methyladenine glycosylase